MKLTNKEQRLALLLSKGIVIILAILFYIIRAFFKFLFKTKRWLFRLAIVILITWSALNTLQTVAYAPKANATQFQYMEKPKTEREQIINYIHEVFGSESSRAFQLLECENKSLNPVAVHDNEKWGQGKGKDYGIFQINNYWQGVSNQTFLLDYKININIAYNIYHRTNDFRMWTCGKKLGI